MALKDKFDEFSLRPIGNVRGSEGAGRHVRGQWLVQRRQARVTRSTITTPGYLRATSSTGTRWSGSASLTGRSYSQTGCGTTWRRRRFFFGSNGSHILYGRSLIYRWAVLTPLVLAHAQKLWPHDAGTLHRIVRGNLEFHCRNGASTGEKGKLRETYSDKGTVDIRESYIDGGHPYWGMQAFAMWLIPRDDPFWNARGGSSPVEKSDFVRPIEAPGLVLTGHKASGQVKLLQGRSAQTDPHYRDKYNKFVYSSHFPMNIVQRDDICPWDNALVLRDRRTRRSFGRGGFERKPVDAEWFRILVPA